MALPNSHSHSTGAGNLSLATKHANDNPSVIAVVLNWSAYEETANCVRSLKTASYRNLNIILVDNASPDGSGMKLQEAFAEFKFLAQKTNGGYAAGNNAGIRMALEHGADYVLILNNDVVVERCFLEPMIALLRSEDNIGVVTCTIRYLNEPQHVYYAAGRFSKWLCTGLNHRRASASNFVRSGLSLDVNFINGSLMLVKREVFEQVGLLEEKFFMYFEDLEFSRRVNQSYRLVYTPQSVVYHKSGAGRGWSSYSEAYLYYHTRNRFLVFSKESPIFQVYVILFSSANVIAKSVVIAVNLATDVERAIGQLKALWRGLRDGFVSSGLFQGES